MDIQIRMFPHGDRDHGCLQREDLKLVFSSVPCSIIRSREMHTSFGKRKHNGVMQVGGGAGCLIYCLVLKELKLLSFDV